METQPSTKDREQEEASEDEDVDVNVGNIQENVEIPQPSLRRSTRVRNPPKRYDDFVSSVALISSDGESICYQEAMTNAKLKIAV